MLGLAQTDRVAKLSDGQRDCLRLVAENWSSKEIARILAISPHTVDQRLKRAATILAVESRFEAARVFASHSRQNGPSLPVYESLVYQPPGLSQFKKFADIDVPANERDPLGGSGEDATLHEAQASYFSMFGAQAKPRTLLSILADAGYENDLPTSWRLVAILAIMLFGIVGFAVLVNVVEGLSRIY